MTVPPITITPDEAILALVEMAELYERVSRDIGDTKPSKFSALYVRRERAGRRARARRGGVTPQKPVVTKIRASRVKPPVFQRRGSADRGARADSRAISRRLENCECYISCEKDNSQSHMEVGMQVWTYPEKRMEILGARRWEVEWHEAKPGLDDLTEDERDALEPQQMVNTYHRHFSTAEKAQAFAQRVYHERPIFFGVVEINQQVVDWYVEEDRIAEWVNVGDPEYVESE